MYFMDDHVVIALFRHGLTEENKRKAYMGWSDSPLCPETQNLATTRTYECYFSSDLQRCVRTANLMFGNAEIFHLKELREMNFGKWEGKTYEELKDEELYRQWVDDPITIHPPDGESYPQFSKRVQNSWNQITQMLLSKNIRRCALITHGGVIRLLLEKFAPEEKPFWSWNVPHGTGFELIFEKVALRRRERCTLLQEVPITGKELG
ncbi:histidine phosphatase family protein [Bacillus sp. USDA818B3_A]|uniref:histidine phosphatase family protein n=1 Tax=Bacillus sp. USDA818B3_A TaxID=2698834 RepID=UPI001F3B3D80|nr:histidine phosphatase family protein [Bacillus sp. USDA818B3_A]